MSPSLSVIPDCIGFPATLSLDTSLRRPIELRYIIPRDLGSPDDFCKALNGRHIRPRLHDHVPSGEDGVLAFAVLRSSVLGAAWATGAFLAMAFFGVDFLGGL